MTVRNWATRHLQNAIGSLGTLSRNPIASALTIAVIGIALALPATLGVIVQSGREVAGGWETVRDFSVYLTPGLPGERAAAIARDIRGDRLVASVELITADAALAELRRDPGFGPALDALEANPLPATLIVRPDSTATAEQIRSFGEKLAGVAGVEQVKLDMAWLERLNIVLDFLRRAVLIGGSLLLVAVLIIVGNTIRLDIQNRAEEIEVAKLLGATDAFVRRPFLYLGLWYGILGGVLAIAIVALCLWLLGAPLARLAGLYGSAFGLGGLNLTTAAGVVGGGVVAGLGGAWTAVARHLFAIQPRL